MKRLIIIFIVSLTTVVNATNYYVRNGGNDSGAGTSEATAWASLIKVNSEWSSGTFIAGDTIFFRRGDTWHGTIDITRSGTQASPIVINAYGSGNKPIIDGFATLASWTRVGTSSIYYASLSPESAPNMLIVDDTMRVIGRYPNTGWLTMDVINSSGTVPVGDPVTITDNDLPSSPDFDGAEMVIRFDRWTILRAPITNHNGTSLTFTTPYASLPYANWGYFIQNHLATLDQFGEWYYDSSTSRLYMDFTGSSPGSHVVRVSSVDNLVRGNYAYATGISVNNLHLRGSNSNAIYFYDNVTDIDVIGCDIEFSGRNAIYMHGGIRSIVTNNNISHSNYNGIFLRFASYANIGYNNISNTANYPGHTGLVDDHYSQGIICEYSSGNNVIEHNNILNTAYIPIRFGGENTVVRYNYIDNYCYIKDDGAGIYVFNDRTAGKQVFRNIVKNGIGAPDGTATPGSNSAHGLYTDGGSANVSFRENILYYAGVQGWHANLPVNVELVDNYFFQNRQFIGLWKFGLTHWWDGTNVFINGLNIKRNVFISTVVNQNLPNVIDYHNSTSVMYGSNYIDEVKHFGEWDSNYYYMPQQPAVYIKHNSYVSNAPYTIARWSAVYDFDAHSTVIEPEPTYILNSVGSNLINNGTFNSSISGWSSSSSDLTISWNQSGIGTGGALQMTSTQQNMQWYWWANVNAAITPIIGGVVDNQKHYLFKATGRSSIDQKTLSMRLRSTGTGHEIQRFFIVNSTNTDNTILLSYPESVSSDAYLRIVACDDPVTTYLDNIELYEANVTLRNSGDYLHFIYNETGTNKAYTLSSSMKDHTGTSYSGTIILQPWKCMVLIGEGVVAEGGVTNFGKNRQGVMLKGRNGRMMIYN
jgi:hypothetical protein